jgi:hypothetical protein
VFWLSYLINKLYKFHNSFLDSSPQINLFPFKKIKNKKIKVIITRRVTTGQKQTKEGFKYVDKSSWSFG